MGKQLINENEARSAGVLLHISSLPSKYGIGSLGKVAYDFVDFLTASGVKYWQILPLVQTGFGDSPYQSVCCNSGNPYFIDLDMLKEQGLLTQNDLNESTMPANGVDYARLYEVRYPILRKAFSRFQKEDKDFVQFVNEGKFTAYAEYMTVKKKFQNQPFYLWDEPFKYRDERTVKAYAQENEDEFLFWQWLQFTFFTQWNNLKDYAKNKGISFIGDIPLYVAYDSADVWSKPYLFKLDDDLKMTEVAGVPPDYFSATGQLWGNPLYDWERQQEDGYAWWIGRLQDALTTFDVVRVDHFRGLDRYYAIPADSQTAVVGRWRDGPKAQLFRLAKEKLGDMNIIAEDLGTLDDGVKKLLKDTAYPGMKILLFAFEGGDNDYLPKNINYNSICYTGTHDNDTAVGYFERQSPASLQFITKNIEASLADRDIEHKTDSVTDLADALLHLLFESNSCLAIAPAQDLLYLDNTARMNTPSTNEINWKFRLEKLPDEKVSKRLRALLVKYDRI